MIVVADDKGQNSNVHVQNDNSIQQGTEGPFENLKDILDTETGLGYCMNDKDFYREMLVEYIKSDRRADLEGSLEKNDIESYRIAIHSLKSTSLTIGAVRLSEEAKAIESACKEGDVDFVKSQHKKCMLDYKTILDKLSEYLASEKEI